MQPLPCVALGIWENHRVMAKFLKHHYGSHICLPTAPQFFKDKGLGLQVKDYLLQVDKCEPYKKQRQ